MTILCYHAVQPGLGLPLAVSPDAFERHMAWLSRRRRVLDLEQAAAWLDPSLRLPRGLAAVTFDDGFASVYEHAFPVLVRHRVPATVFLVAQTLAPGGRGVDWVDPPLSRPLRTLTLEQVREMRGAGVRFGSHSYTHRDLTTLSERECEADLRQSRELLEDLLREPVRLLAYPKGRHDERVRAAAARAGFTHSFTERTDPGEPVGTQAVPRVGVYPGNGLLALRVKAARWYIPLRTSPVFPLLRRVAMRRQAAPPMG